MEQVGEMLLGVRFEPAGPVTGHLAIRFCSSLPDLIGRHLLIEFCGRGELAHTTLGTDGLHSRGVDA